MRESERRTSLLQSDRNPSISLVHTRTETTSKAFHHPPVLRATVPNKPRLRTTAALSLQPIPATVQGHLHRHPTPWLQPLAELQGNTSTACTNNTSTSQVGEEQGLHTCGLWTSSSKLYWFATYLPVVSEEAQAHA